MTGHEQQGLNFTPEKQKLLGLLLEKEGLGAPDTSKILPQESGSAAPL